MAAGMLMYRPNGALVGCNRAFLDIIGYGKDGIEDLDLAAVMPQKYGKCATENLQTLKRKGRYGPYEEEYIDKNGKAVPVRLNDVLIEGAGGEDYICSSVLDMSRCPEEKQLESQFSLISQSVDNAFDAFSIVNNRGEFIYVNKAHAKLWGYDSVAEFIGMSPAIHYANPGTAQEIIERTIERGHCEIEFEAKRKDGSLFCALMRSKLDHDMEGREIYIGSCIDISARKRTEEELFKLKRALEHSPSAIIITDKEGAIEYVNPKFTQITGYTQSEVLGKNPNKMLFSSKTSRTKAHYNMWHALSAGKNWSGILRNVRKDDSSYWAKTRFPASKTAGAR